MPLTTQETVIRVARLGGQAGRSPIASIGLGQASKSEGAFHHAEFLAPAKGTRKLTSVPIPASAYELRGMATGILEIPVIEGYDGAWLSSPGTQRSWAIQFCMKPLRSGDFIDTSGDGQVFFATASQIGTHPAGGVDIESIRASWVVAAGVYTARIRWGTSTYDVPMTGSDALPFDMTDWISMRFYAINGNPTATLNFDATQQLTPTTFRTLATPLNQAATRGWTVHHFWLGGALSERRPIQGVYRPSPCVVSEVVVAAVTNANTAPTTSTGIGLRTAPWVRAGAASVFATATTVGDVWELKDDSDEPVSLGGRKGRIVGGTARRSTGITTTQSGAMRFDGSGGLTIQDAEKLRETPKTRTQGGVEGHYLELPEYTIAVCLDPRRAPWRFPSVQRACFLCWSTPLAQNLGVSTDPAGASGVRPAEHLRLEIARVATDWYIRGYFGEIEPESLKHPSGTIGGSSSTAWPPPLSTAGEPPATWNKPQGDPTAAHGTANGKSAFQVLIGADADATHPMEYAWWVFAQRKFVGQGSASNACAVYVRRVAIDGTPDLAFGEVDDANADAAGERHPANQSCFSAARCNGNDLNFRTDSYALTLGFDGGSQYGEERKSYDNVTRLPTMYPVDDAFSRFQFSDEGDQFPYVGRCASFVAFKRYLLAKDRLAIATAGNFEQAMRLQFQDDYLLSYNFDEAAGSILRDGRGNDISFAEKIGIAAVINDQNLEQPQLMGAFPRPPPPWHNEIDKFANEYGAVNGVAQRIDSGGREELYAVAQCGLYEYDRDTHALTRIGTLPGQGGPGQASVVVDNNDIIHIAGGKGRPVVITRDRTVAISGIDPPHYSAPQSLIFQNKTITGGISITFQTKKDANLNNLAGYEIDDQATVQFAIGYWSEVLRTRSRPGNVVTCRYIDSSVNVPTVNNLPLIRRYRILVSGLPPPKGANANLITHWEIYRTDSNGSVLILEKRIPISSQPVAILIGDIPLGTGEEADVFRDVPPEGMKAIVAFGDRLIGVGPPEFPRSIVWTKRRDGMNWPPVYVANMNQTNAPAAGCVIRRGRAFPFSRDHLYQLIESTLDANLLAGQVESLSLDTLAEGVGGLTHFAAITDHENGIYLPGNKSVYLTEGGTYRSLSIENDSSGAAGGDDFSWPDSWDLTQPDRFVTFHDERRRLVGICGPAIEDPNRIDAMLIFYEGSQIAADGRSFMSDPHMSRLKGIDATCVAHILDPPTGNREVWIGTQLGYLMELGEFGSLGVDYDWLESVAPKYGEVIDVPSTTTLRLDGSYPTAPASDLFRGSTLRVYRVVDEVLTLISTRRVTIATVALSWVDVTLDGVHSAEPGDTWSIGAMPLDWQSGKIDFGETLTDKRLHAADLAMNE